MGHDVVEIVSGNESIIVKISLVEDVVNLVLSQVLTQVLSDLLEFVGSDFSLC